MLRVTIGKAIGQGASGVRRVLLWGLPKKTRRNTRVRFNADRAFTNNNKSNRGQPTSQEPSNQR